MKNIISFCLVSLLMANVLFAQTKPATKPKTTTVKPAAPGTKPYTPPATTTPPVQQRVATPPATTETTVTPEMQEQYDKMNNTTKPATTNKTSKPASSTTTSAPSRSSNSTSNSNKSETYKSKPVEKVAKAKPEKAARRPSEDSKFHIGFRGGINLSTIAESGKFVTEGLDNQMGYHGGLVLNFGGKGVSFQPEILFSQIGTKIDAPGLTGSVTINTVTVPLLLKFSLGSDAFRFFITAGGFGSYYLSGSSLNPLTNKTEAITFATGDARIEYGATGGAGLQFGSKTKFFVEGRYNYGLGDNGDKVAGVKESFSRTIMASVGVLIPL